MTDILYFVLAYGGGLLLAERCVRIAEALLKRTKSAADAVTILVLCVVCGTVLNTAWAMKWATILY